MSKQDIILDATMLTSLMGCARAFNFRFNSSLLPSGGKSNSLECGSLVHVILEHYGKAIIAGSSRSNSILSGMAAGQEYRIGYKENNKYIKDESEKGMTNTPEESDKYNTGWKFVFETMEKYFDYYKNDSWIPIDVECTRGSIIYEDDDIRIMWKAKFDLISDTNNGFISIDHKTMKQRRDTLSLNNQFIGQCVLLKSRNVLVNKIGFQSSLSASERFIRSTISYSADRLAEWVNDIVPYYARMYVAYETAGHYPPNFTNCEGKYGHCNYKEVCESDRSMRDEVLKINFTKTKQWDI